MKMLHMTAMMHLFLFLILILTIQTEEVSFPLNEYKNSIDDQFEGCEDKMYKMIEGTKGLLKKEKKSNKDFEKAWKQGQDFINGKLSAKLTPLERMSEMALYAYSTKHIYGELNEKMRDGKASYMKKFGLISLHFLITHGIQTRNARERKKRPPNATGKKCPKVFRRTKVNIKPTGSTVRFGSFASTTLRPLKPKFKGYGKKTCFVVYTCYGAGIADVSWVTMKTQHSAAVMHLFIIHIILTKHMALGAPAQNSKSCVVQPSAHGAALTGRLMEDTTAHWMSVMVVLGQSGTEIRPSLSMSHHVKLTHQVSVLWVDSFRIYMDEYVNSIDDEFLTCKEDMYRHITTKQLLNRELTFNVNFGKAWAQARNYLISKGKVSQQVSRKEDLRNIALCAYTTEHIYRDLNNRMRTGRDSYKHFGLISLHFLITDAIQRRNRKGACQTTYRRTGVAIVIKENKLVRFGTFTSSTRSPNNPKFKGFGRETCFIIYTCYGAHISDVSVFPNEDEVLIPPYERFTGRRLASSPELADCKLVYELRSKGKKSNMKCKYVNQQKKLPPKTGLWPTG
ncbi:hypothetical protein NFI96_005888 [Prochilodus magdalenae]|nr:hypothetical protein NFI96_005888 [Prochilodus magdalenae]